MVAHIYYPSTWDAEAYIVQDLPELQKKTLSQKRKKYYYYYDDYYYQ